MANYETAEIDVGCIELRDGEFRDEILTFAAAATYVKGTILARQTVGTTVTASAVTGTGNGTVTLATVVEGPVVPIIGVYTLRNTAAAANGGTWRLEDPNAAVVASGLVMTVGAGAATIFEAAGLRWTITDGSTDFALGDTFTLTVASGAGKLVPFNPAGAGGAQLPRAVLTYDVVRASGGDTPIRALVSGVVNRNRLIIFVDGTGVNITNEICDQLRGRSIIPIDVHQMGSTA